MVKIEINGNSIKAREGSMLIDVADDAGIPIPRFCYHKKLSVAANCRMCLVEVAGAPKALPACATPVTDGMKVQTRSPKALAAQKAVMEFLLINHPLDCPICDQGGECELQDVSMLYGDGVSRFTEGKRILGEKDIGPLVQTDMTRCIHCTRCVRFGQEVAGIMELGCTGRGEHMEIGTYVEKAMVSELSGNVIDLCPVGALTSKPYRYTARAWELKAVPVIMPHDGMGSHAYIHHKNGDAKRVVPREQEALNEVWLSDRDRFAYAGLDHNRLLKPMRKVDGQWQETDWETALVEVAALLNGQLSADVNSVGALVSPTATAEELYLLQKLLRSKGCHNIDHRLHQQDFALDAVGAMPYLSLPVAEVDAVRATLIVGSNLRHEQPLLNQRLRKSTQAKGKVMAINPVDYSFNYRLHAKAIVSMPEMVNALARVALAVAGERALDAAQQTLLAGQQVDDTARKMAELLSVDGNKLILLGQVAQSHPSFARLAQLAALVGEWTGAQVSWLAEAGNSLGAALVGAEPGNQGRNAAQMLSTGMQNWVLWGVEPGKDCLLPQGAQLSGRVVSFTAFDTPSLRTQSDWMLPLGSFGETAGSYVNYNGLWQGSEIALNLPGQAKPGWKVLRVLGNMMGVSGFDYTQLAQVTDEARASARVPAVLGAATLTGVTTHQMGCEGLARVAELPMYASDMLVRASAPLQAHAHAGEAVLRVNPSDAMALGAQTEVSVTLADGSTLTLPLVKDARIAPGNVLAPMALLSGLPADCLRLVA